MFPVKFVRDNIERFKTATEAKNEKFDWAEYERLDSERRGAIALCEERRRIQKDLTEKIAASKNNKEAVAELLAQARKYSDEVRSCEEKSAGVETQLERLVERIPNLPHESVPVGKNPSANTVVRTWGEIEQRPFPVLPHWDIAETLGVIDFARGAKITGNSFPAFLGTGARLVRSLINFMLDLHAANGFREAWAPALVNRDSMFGTGQLPKLEDDMYHLDREDFFLIPTAEVPVTNLFRNEVIPDDQLPLYLTGYTPCFRREAGAYGKDTKGLIRVHQFDKVEMVKFVKPETSYDELETLVGEAEKVLQCLKLPYRVVLLCTGDMSFAAAKCYDLEVWAPGVQKWLEVSSCSNFEAFQARRAKIRYRTGKGTMDYVHTLNGSGVALPRTIIGILENYQQADGTVIIPDVLQPYMNGLKVIEKPLSRNWT